MIVDPGLVALLLVISDLFGNRGYPVELQAAQSGRKGPLRGFVLGRVPI